MISTCCLNTTRGGKGANWWASGHCPLTPSPPSMIPRTCGGAPRACWPKRAPEEFKPLVTRTVKAQDRTRPWSGELVTTGEGGRKPREAEVTSHCD